MIEAALHDVPEPGSLERWAWDFVHATTLREKLAPDAPPTRSEATRVARRLVAPGRPAELAIQGKAGKQRGFASPHGRARAMHAFFHHELQAAELFAFAILAYPDVEPGLRDGLVRILLDEVRHANLYVSEVERLGFEVGAFPVRDWFWERIPSCPDVVSFLATMGLGFEAGNLDHAARFERIFRDVGDLRAAEVQSIVARDEVEHVKFGAAWFRRIRGELTFDDWTRALPSPLSPMVMRGATLELRARRDAGMPDAFLERLESWTPEPPSS